MGSPASELNQDCKPQQTYSMLLKSFGDQPDQHQKLEEFLAHLEEEWLKIEAFKRELPLCMQLLANAMEASRQQLQSYKQQENHEPKPILEEFIPLKHSNSEGSEKASNISEKSSWMVSAQLWSQSNNELTKQQTTVLTSTNKETDQQSYGIITSTKLSLDDKKGNGSGGGSSGGGGGAFLPFTKEIRNTCSSPTLLALASTEKDTDEKKCLDSENNNRMSCTRQMSSSKLQQLGGEMMEHGKGGVLVAGGSNHQQQQLVDQTQGTTSGNSPSSQTHRKARRCWSPDLHRRFVNALQMLGGSQVATPKQIRELMKVDGLTNDEVKSHLQKYRLHTRRPSPSPQASGAPTPQLVVLGSIWVPPEYATAAAAAAAAHHNAATGGGGPTAIYGAHPGTLTTTHYCAPPVPQEFYPAPPQPHHQFHHHHVYKISSQTHSSPESDIRGTGDRSESIEDGKSDSSSWKGDSGENGGGGGGGERRGLASLRDEGDKSNNGSEITLKF